MDHAPADRAREVGARRIGEARRDLRHERCGAPEAGGPACSRVLRRATGRSARVHLRRIACDERRQQLRGIVDARTDARRHRCREEAPVRGTLPREQHGVVAAERCARKRLPHPCGLPGEQGLDAEPRLLREHPFVMGVRCHVAAWGNCHVGRHRCGAHERCRQARERRCCPRAAPHRAARHVAAQSDHVRAPLSHLSSAVEREVSGCRCAGHAVVTDRRSHGHGRRTLHGQVHRPVGECAVAPTRGDGEGCRTCGRALA